jgi:hypothetical protein
MFIDPTDPRLTDHERHVLRIIIARLTTQARDVCTADPPRLETRPVTAISTRQTS